MAILLQKVLSNQIARHKSNMATTKKEKRNKSKDKMCKYSSIKPYFTQKIASDMLQALGLAAMKLRKPLIKLNRTGQVVDTNIWIQISYQPTPILMTSQCKSLISAIVNYTWLTYCTLTCILGFKLTHSKAQ